MKVIALTGGVASGKTTVCRAFAKHSVPIIDTDLLARQAVTPGSQALETIRQRYGDKISRYGGELDRAALGHIIFADPQERQWLENLLHPLIADLARREHQRLSDLSASSYCIYAVPLLIETLQADQKQPFDYARIALVDLDTPSQLARLQDRSDLSLKDAKQRIDSQTNRERRFGYVQDVIDNSEDIGHTIKQVNTLHAFYKDLQ